MSHVNESCRLWYQIHGATSILLRFAKLAVSSRQDKNSLAGSQPLASNDSCVRKDEIMTSNSWQSSTPVTSLIHMSSHSYEFVAKWVTSQKYLPWQSSNPVTSLMHMSSWQKKSRHRSTCLVVAVQYFCDVTHLYEFVAKWVTYRSTCHGSPVLLWCVYNNDYCTIFLSIVT